MKKKINIRPLSDDDIPFKPNLAQLEAAAAIGDDLIETVGKRGCTIGRGEIRYIVDLYYQVQEFRKAAANQKRASSDDANEPVRFVSWIVDLQTIIEKNIARALEKWTDQHPPSVWAKSIMGVAGTLSAGIAAHVDIEKSPNVSSLWSFAGYNPTMRWEKGQKRPFDAKLKTICWLIGQSFIKISGNPRSFYGREYRKWKALYVDRNETGDYQDQAKQKLGEKRFRPGTDALDHLKEGKLPPFVIDLRAQRKAVKLFLSHWWEVSYRHHYGTEPPVPYSMAQLGHTGIVWARDAVAFENGGKIPEELAKILGTKKKVATG